MAKRENSEESPNTKGRKSKTWIQNSIKAYSLVITANEIPKNPEIRKWWHLMWADLCISSAVRKSILQPKCQLIDYIVPIYCSYFTDQYLLYIPFLANFKTTTMFWRVRNSTSTALDGLSAEGLAFYCKTRHTHAWL